MMTVRKSEVDCNLLNCGMFFFYFISLGFSDILLDLFFTVEMPVVCDVLITAVVS